MPYHTNRISSRRFRGSSWTAPARKNGARRGPKKDNIDPRRFVRTAKPAAQEVYQPKHASFNEFNINLLIKANLDFMGITSPTAIQDQAIPAILAGRDLIGLADTGTGKTAAFAVPLLQSIMTSNGRALIVAPTRELAQQIDSQFRAIGKGSNLQGAVLIGGASTGAQLRDLRRGPQIVIGTPGRIKDHLLRGSLKLSGFQFAVLDEVDRMLDMGFIDDVRQILEQLPTPRQSLFFSATLNDRINRLIEGFASQPVTVSVKSGATGENIHQDVVQVDSDGQKLEKLHDILNDEAVSKVIIFEETQRGVERLSTELVSRGFTVDAIHGGKNQAQRQRSLKRFKQNEVNILVATDVAARGIDVSDISHVVNYSLPSTYDDYIHRIGRTGRAGRIGYALTFIPS